MTKETKGKAKKAKPPTNDAIIKAGVDMGLGEKRMKELVKQFDKSFAADVILAADVESVAPSGLGNSRRERKKVFVTSMQESMYKRICDTQGFCWVTIQTDKKDEEQYVRKDVGVLLLLNGKRMSSRGRATPRGVIISRGEMAKFDVQDPRTRKTSDWHLCQFEGDPRNQEERTAIMDVCSEIKTPISKIKKACDAMLTMIPLKGAGIWTDLVIPSDKEAVPNLDDIEDERSRTRLMWFYFEDDEDMENDLEEPAFLRLVR